MNSSVERQSELLGVNLNLQPDIWVQEKKSLLELSFSVLGFSLCNYTEGRVNPTAAPKKL